MNLYDPLEAIFPLRYRIVIGLVILLTLALLDWRNHGRNSKRIREYGFVCGVIVATIFYAVVHDLITSTISSEYFTAGKGLAPDNLPLRAAWLATLAAIGPGALIGAALLIANNPSEKTPQLLYSRLGIHLVYPLLGALLGAVGFGLLGFFDVRNLSTDLVGSVEHPVRFMTVWGIHWGTYIGGFLGLCFAIYLIRRERALTGAIGRLPVAAITFVAISLAVRSTQACSCAGINDDWLKAARTALIVKSEPAYRGVNLSVVETIRGQSPSKIVVHDAFPGSNCTRVLGSYKSGVKYLYVTNKTNEGLSKPIHLDKCSYFIEVEKAAHVLEIIRSGKSKAGTKSK